MMNISTLYSRAVAVCVLIAAVTLPSQAVTTTPLLHPLFTNDMVLQRDASDPVWGWADPGTSITVTVYNQNNAVLQTKTATAASDGSWKTTIGPFSLVPGNAAYHFTVAKPGSSQTVTNVLIGDVWLCSGQSNMAYTLYGFPRMANSMNEIAAAQAAPSAPYIRQFKASQGTVASTPQSTFVGGVDSGGWTLASSNATNFTAIGYFMAKQIYDSQQVPIGLLSLNWGGTNIHPWIPADYLRTIADYTPAVDTLEAGTVTLTSPTAIYNAMVAPVAGLQIKGAVWYQGESEALTQSGVGPSGSPKYQAMLKQYLAGTRATFGQPNLPFVLVQLSTSGTNTTPVQSATSPLFAEVREAQLNTALGDSNTRLVTTVDCGFGGSNADIHPIDKQTPGKRVGQAALELAYGQATEYRTPTFNHATVEGGTLRCYFDNVGSGLMVGLKPQGLSQNAAPSPSPVSEVSGGTLTGFSIAGSDKTWFAATATIDSATNTVVVSSASVPSPLYVRYGWCDNPWNTTTGTPLCNLYRKILSGPMVVDGVPVSPFRNDPAYQLSVNSGTPSGMNYTPGQVVAVTAAEAPSGQAFAFWTGDTGVLANATSLATTAALSQPYVSLRAIYQLNASPTGLAATAGSLKVTLSWTALANATTYIIKRATSGDGSYTTIATGVVTTSYTDNSTGFGTTFYYKISATNPAGESPDSAYVNAQPLSASPVNAAWNTNAATGDFGSPNWTSGVTVPTAGGTYTVVSGDSLFFGSSTTATLNNKLSGATYGGLTFNSGASAFTIGGNSFTLSGNITNNSASLQTINTGMTISTGHKTLAGGAGGLTLGGTTTHTHISATGAGLVITGTVNSTGSFTEDGGASNNSGYLAMGGAQTLNVTAGTFSVLGTTNATKPLSAVGHNAGGTSNLNVSGGNLVIGSETGFALANASTGTGVLTISSTGTATINRGTLATTGSSADTRLIMMGKDGANTGIINLNGGTLATDRQFVRDGSSGGGAGTANFVFGGGTLKALGTQPDWLQSTTASSAGQNQGATGGTLNANAQALTSVTTTAVSTIDSNGFAVGVNNAISGAGGFNIISSTGAGTVTFGGANTYTGATAINGGTLAVTGTMTGTGALTVNSPGALGGIATLPMAVTVNNGGTIAPGVGGAGTLTLSGGLMLNTGAVLRMDLAGTATSDKISVSGAFAASGTTTLNLTALGSFAGSGAYPLITGATGISASNFALGTTPSGYVCTLSTSSGTLTLTVMTVVENWRSTYFGTTANSGNAADSADPDGDGMTNAQEFAAGTDPTNAASVLKVTNLAVSGNDFIVSFSTVSGKTYRVERSDTLEAGSWTTVQGNIAGTGGTVQVTDPGVATQSKRFYRIVTP